MDAERRMFGIDHAEVAGFALERLRFPREFTSAVAQHHLLRRAQSSSAGADAVPRRAARSPGRRHTPGVAADPRGRANMKDIDRRHLWVVDPSGSTGPKQVTSGENIEWDPAPMADGSAVTFLASSYNERAHAVVRTADGKHTPLAPSTVPADFPSKSFVKPQAVTITAADGMVIHGQLFMPPGARSGERLPALIFFHGGSRRQMLLGSHYMYYYSNAYSMNEFLANHGYIVLSVNYRSGIGYGLNFREATNYGAAGASEFNDVIGAGLYLKWTGRCGSQADRCMGRFVWRILNGSRSIPGAGALYGGC